MFHTRSSSRLTLLMADGGRSVVVALHCNLDPELLIVALPAVTTIAEEVPLPEVFFRLLFNGRVCDA